MRLELDRPRTLGELVALTFELFGRHLATFLTLTLIVVAPAVILVDGVWGGYLADGGNAEPSAGAELGVVRSRDARHPGAGDRAAGRRRARAGGG